MTAEKPAAVSDTEIVVGSSTKLAIHSKGRRRIQHHSAGGMYSPGHAPVVVVSLVQEYQQFWRGVNLHEALLPLVNIAGRHLDGCSVKSVGVSGDGCAGKRKTDGSFTKS